MVDPTLAIELGPPIATGLMGWFGARAIDKRQDRRTRKDQEREAVAAISRVTINLREAILRNFDEPHRLEESVIELNAEVSDNLGRLPRKLRPKVSHSSDGLYLALINWRNAKMFSIPDDVETEFLDMVLTVTNQLHFDLTEWWLGRKKNIAASDAMRIFGPSIYAETFFANRRRRMAKLKSALLATDSTSEEGGEEIEKIMTEILDLLSPEERTRFTRSITKGSGGAIRPSASPDDASENGDSNGK